MQEARHKAFLIVALALASAAQAEPVRAAGDLPLSTVMSYLHAAGVDAPWSVEQRSSKEDVVHRSIEAFFDSEDVAKHSCRSGHIEIDMREQDGRFVVDSTIKNTLYALWPCRFADAGTFHGMDDAIGIERLESGFDSIMSAVDDPGTAKVTFLDEGMRGAFAKLRPDDFDNIRDGGKGPLTLCFFTHVHDILGAPETLSAEVTPGSPPQIKVDICGVIDIVATKK